MIKWIKWKWNSDGKGKFRGLTYFLIAFGLFWDICISLYDSEFKLVTVPFFWPLWVFACYLWYRSDIKDKTYIK